jgi:hypothetical protein
MTVDRFRHAPHIPHPRRQSFSGLPADRKTGQDLASTERHEDIAAVHIFRFEQDRIVELWDVAQPLSKDSPNQNGMF